MPDDFMTPSPSSSPPPLTKPLPTPGGRLLLFYFTLGTAPPCHVNKGPGYLHGVLTPRRNKSAPESLPAADKGRVDGGSVQGSLLDSPPGGVPLRTLLPFSLLPSLLSSSPLHLVFIFIASLLTTPEFEPHPPPSLLTSWRTCKYEFHAPVATF